MASINVTCPNADCGRTLRVADKFLGVRVKCKYCEQPILIEVEADPSPGVPEMETMDLPLAAGVFEQQTLAGAVPPAPGVFEQRTLAGPAPAGASVFEKRTQAGPAPAGASVFEKRTQAGPAPAPAQAPLPVPEDDGPPPLPPRPARGPEIKVVSLLVSLVSLAVICGSIAGMIMIRKPADIANTAPAVVPTTPEEKYAAIALESNGVRFVVVPIQVTPDGYTLGTSVLENREVLSILPKGKKELDTGNLGQMMKEVSKFVQSAREQGVAEDRLFVLCNSGVLRELEGDPAALDRAKTSLGAAVRDAGGGPVMYVATDDEARFGALACVPPKDRSAAVFLDLGSSSARCGYHEADRAFTGFDLPLGRRKFAEAVKAQVAQDRAKRSFAVNAESLRPDLLNDPVKKAGRPALVNRKKYYLVGGGAWAAAVLTHPGEMRHLLVTLKEDDLKKFDDLVSAPSQTLAGVREKMLQKVQLLPDAERAFAEKEVGTVLDRFNLDDLVVMAKILRAFSDECEFKAKDVQFFTNGLYAWPLGFLLARSGVEK